MLGEKGINLVQSIVLDMGFTWHPSNQPLEAGIDGWVELRDRSTGEVQNVWLPLQSHARTNLPEDEQSVSYNCSQKDVEYWMKGSSPVILIVSKPEEKKAWWVSVKDYFKGRDLQSDRTLGSTAQLTNYRLNGRRMEVAEQPVRDDNLLFANSRYRDLTSNLLQVRRYVQDYYRASALHRSIKECGKALKEAKEYPPSERSS